MAIGFGVACKKPEPRKRVQGRVKRHARTVVRDVRAAVVERDGMCRVPPGVFGACQGVLEWAHLLRRFKTRGQPAETRHTTQGTLMLCKKHHLQFDAHELQITALSVEHGADGPLEFWRP